MWQYQRVVIFWCRLVNNTQNLNGILIYIQIRVQVNQLLSTLYYKTDSLIKHGHNFSTIILIQ